MNRHKGIIVNKVTLGDGHFLVLDIKNTDQEVHLINLYAPNVPKNRKMFFQHIFHFCNQRTIMMGDFNSIEISLDCLSGNLDPTSELLTSLLISHSLKELDGTLGARLFVYKLPLNVLGISLNDSKSDVGSVGKRF